ncbi:hypothetical protein C8R47DRAFT_1082390 [Mycena vitilis]|nr:hypothetical protein C8R47DRAFT_1082390 [Mycena vitilis]
MSIQVPGPHDSDGLTVSQPGYAKKVRFTTSLHVKTTPCGLTFNPPPVRTAVSAAVSLKHFDLDSAYWRRGNFQPDLGVEHLGQRPFVQQSQYMRVFFQILTRFMIAWQVQAQPRCSPNLGASCWFNFLAENPGLYLSPNVRTISAVDRPAVAAHAELDISEALARPLPPPPHLSPSLARCPISMFIMVFYS